MKFRDSKQDQYHSSAFNCYIFIVIELKECNYGPLELSDHVVQKSSNWGTNDAVGHVRQSNQI